MRLREHESSSQVFCVKDSYPDALYLYLPLFLIDLWCSWLWIAFFCLSVLPVKPGELPLHILSLDFPFKHVYELVTDFQLLFFFLCAVLRAEFLWGLGLVTLGLCIVPAGPGAATVPLLLEIGCMQLHSCLRWGYILWIKKGYFWCSLSWCSVYWWVLLECK